MPRETPSAWNKFKGMRIKALNDKLKSMLTKWCPIVRNQMAMSLLQTLGMGAVLSAGALGLASLVNSMNKTTLAGRVSSTPLEFKRRVIQAIEDDEAWNRTLNLPENATALGCMISTTDSTPCADSSAGDGALFKLVDRKGNVVYDSLIATNGITLGGALCNGYNATEGNDHCPFRLDMRVKLLCAGTTANCDSPQVWINGKFLAYAPKSESNKTPFNPEKNNFSLQRGGSSSISDLLQEACTSIGGTFDSPTKNCSLTCPADRVLAGFSIGGPNCVIPTKLANVSCPSGQALTGFDANGAPLCVNTAPTPPPEPEVLSSCKEILQKGKSTGNGVYSIDPDGEGGQDKFDVYCNMSYLGGGWTRLSTKSSPPALNYADPAWTNGSGTANSPTAPGHLSKAFHTLKTFSEVWFDSSYCGGGGGTANCGTSKSFAELSAAPGTCALTVVPGLTNRTLRFHISNGGCGMSRIARCFWSYDAGASYYWLGLGVTGSVMQGACYGSPNDSQGDMYVR